MSRLLGALLLAATAAAPAPGSSPEGYQRAKWGMSVDDVKALYEKAIDGDQARKIKPGMFDKKGDFVLAETTILKRKAYATFSFGKKGLEDVVVRPDEEKAENCPRLAEAYEEKYGAPKEKSLEDTADLYLASYAWQLAETRIEFDCSSIRTKAGLAKMKKKEPDAVFPAALPADAVRVHYLRKAK